MSDPSITILKAGITSIQDLGRFGNRRFGIPYSGCMDQFAGREALSAFDSKNPSVLETFFEGLQFMVNCRCFIYVSGAAKALRINDRLLKAELIELQPKDIVKLEQFGNGFISYISFSKSLLIEPYMNSYSTLTGYKFNEHLGFLTDGQQIRISDEDSNKTYGEEQKRFYSQQLTVRYVEGPEYNKLTNLATKTLSSESFEISKGSNRIGYRLIGKTMQCESEEMDSVSTFPGTMQLNNEGQLIVLMRDAQVTGGYPRIGSVIDDDLNYLSQVMPGGKVRFEKVNLDYGK